MAGQTVCPGRNGQMCGVVLPARIGPGRPRRYCDKHLVNQKSMPQPLDADLANGNPGTLVSIPPPPVDVPVAYTGPLGPDSPDAGLPRRRIQIEPSYRAQLERMERVNSPEGSLVLALCWTLDHEYHTGAARASLVKQLRDAWSEATAGAPVEPDALDEITRKRREKFGG